MIQFMAKSSSEAERIEPQGHTQKGVDADGVRSARTFGVAPQLVFVVEVGGT